MRNSNLKTEEIFKKIVIFFFAIFPLFDIVYLYSHITTLLRVFCLLTFALATLFIYRDSKKDFKFLMAYYLALMGYLIVDLVHAGGFASLVPGNFNYSVMSEAMTLLKLAMPFTIFFILKYQRLNRNEFFLVVDSWIFLIAGSIVLSNFLGFSLGSYTDQITTYSIFSWWMDLSVLKTATKGFFAVANQVAIVLLLLGLFSIYQFLFMRGRAFIGVILVSLACLMLGTRVSTLGGFMSFLVIVIAYFIYCLYFKKKISHRIIGVVLVCLFWIFMLPFSPNANRLEEISNAYSDEGEKVVNTDYSYEIENNAENKKDEDESIKDFVQQSINRGAIGEQFYLEFYPCEYDPDFWRDIVLKQNEEKYDYRKIEIEIVKRIKRVDNRWTNELFGISNSRIQTVGNLERDFILQYFAFGIIGLLLVTLFYLLIVYRIGRDVLIGKTFFDIVVFFSIGLFVFASYMSGNSLNFLATTVPMAFLVSSSGKYKDC